ncbi:MAG: 1-acyl-sn-glycerol-3-phosphate acyltransferase [Corynebacteriales bacterium]|nr:1-acyl-sn-glycerol-3-phosphate acyltransferase [Mycobacteriales bacterium]
MFFWLCKYVFIGPWLRLVFRPKLRGTQHSPETGAAVFASNHLSFSDSVFLMIVVKRHITFLAKAEYFNSPGIKGFFTKWFFKAIGQVAIDRSSGSAATAALDTGLRVLNRGDFLGIYPEGTRSPDGRLYRGKTGVARMVLQSNTPVIPVVMVNTDKIQPIGSKWPKIMRVGIQFGEPLDFSRYEGMAGDRLVERAVTDEIMATLARMSGQEYVDVYAAGVKSGAVKARPARRATNAAAEEDEDLL